MTTGDHQRKMDGSLDFETHIKQNMSLAKTNVQAESGDHTRKITITSYMLQYLRLGTVYLTIQ